jgi:hypothetical protein
LLHLKEERFDLGKCSKIFGQVQVSHSQKRGENLPYESGINLASGQDVYVCKGIEDQLNLISLPCPVCDFLSRHTVEMKRFLL